MARQIIDIDTVQPNGKKGDPARLMSQKVNGNFAELYGLLGGLAAVGGVNMLINCGLPINQRVFAGGALAAGAYGYDRWKAGAGGCNVTINATTGVFTHTSGSLQQIVEAPVLAWGQPLTISVENPSGSITVSVGGATGTITSGTGRRGVTVTPSGSGNMTVQLTATGVSYSRPQLERGSAATAFDARPAALELLLCQRYYETSFEDGVAPSLGAASGLSMQSTGYTSGRVRLAFVPFKVRKRAAPAMTAFTDSLANPPRAGGFAIYNASNYPSAAIAWVDVNQTGCGGFLDYSSGITVGQSYWTRGNWTADAEL
ncbi:hypothetical protein DI041_04075 [Stenotrophomonas maltophilia]|uniref:hypothetical protein n=1 Tax=Stenotrophomonas maltophilia TaxID=40324 RepID=UPI0010AB3685|nr:hypothetical protein [Stenotrophomonas maltophilia]TIE20987.1 hypothetical protein DI034_02055 [Stenotrophomonas maltophilia]TIE64502.1 hypothetical protein DI041_04075 [Stenotrophomonas maltophilia]